MASSGRADLLFFLVIDVLRLVGCCCNGPFYRNMYLTCFWYLLVWFPLPWFIILHTIGAALGIFCDLVHDNSKKHGSMGRKESEIVDNVFATM
jgi:hypothetical protein